MFWDILLNPKVILGIVVAGFVLFFAYTFNENGRLKSDLKTVKEDYKELSTAFQDHKELYDKDIKRLDKLSQSKIRVIKQEQQLDNDTSNIPTTLNDRPFTDPNNLAYAGKIRQSQLDRMGPDE